MSTHAKALAFFWLALSYAATCAAGDYTAVYHECLRQAREKIKKDRLELCEAGSGLGLEKPEIQKCIANIASLQISDGENKVCLERARASAGVNEGSAPRVLRHFDDAQAFATPTVKKESTEKREPPPKADSPAPERETKKSETPTARSTPPPASTPADTSAAENEASQDVARCRSAMTTASECCNNPLSCSDRLNSADARSLGVLNGMVVNGAKSGGVGDYCRQMNSLGNNSGNVNSGLAAICAGTHNNCSSTCGELARKYSDMLDSCDNCAEQAIYENARTALLDQQTSCSDLRVKSDQLALNGLGAANNAAVAEYCGRMAGDPASVPSLNRPRTENPGEPYINHLLAYNCDVDPNGPGCRGLGVQESKSGEVGFQGDESSVTSEDFNIPETSAQSGGYSGNGVPTTQAPTRSRAGATVPNNTGGTVPGASSSAGPAGFGGGARPAAVTAPGVNTEIQKGFQGGNGYSQPVSTSVNSSTSDSTLGAWRPASGSLDNLDLRQYLPGGSRAAGRRLANSQINPKEENIFIRISNKMNEKCRLGLLWQCR